MSFTEIDKLVALPIETCRNPWYNCVCQQPVKYEDRILNDIKEI